MFNKLIIILLLVNTNNVIACVAPIHGEHIDNLIEVTLNEDENNIKYGRYEYFISFPKRVEEYEFGFIQLFLLNPQNREDSIEVYLAANEHEGKMYSQINYYADYSHNIEVIVQWFVPHCGMLGKKIIKHNKSLKHGTPPVGGAP